MRLIPSDSGLRPVGLVAPPTKVRFFLTFRRIFLLRSSPPALKAICPFSNCRPLPARSCYCPILETPPPFPLVPFTSVRYRPSSSRSSHLFPVFNARSLRYRTELGLLVFGNPFHPRLLFSPPSILSFCALILPTPSYDTGPSRTLLSHVLRLRELSLQWQNVRSSSSRSVHIIFPSLLLDPLHSSICAALSPLFVFDA